MNCTQLFKVYFFLLLLHCSMQLMAQGDVIFIENKGQWKDHIEYKAELSGGYVFLEQDGITYVIDNAPSHPGHENEKHAKKKEEIGRFAYQMKLTGSQGAKKLEGRAKQSYHHNYFIGKDQSKWKSNVQVYKEVVYREVYDKIDLVFKSNTKLLEYDFVVKPGGDVNKIQFKYEGLESVKVIQNQLHLQTPLGTVTELAPVVFTRKGDVKKQVKAAFKLADNGNVSFEILEAYDKSAELIIDPVLVFSTYTGSFADNWGFTATYDNEGNMYAGGIVRDNGYPTTIGAFDPSFNGGFFQGHPCDIVISKFGPDGKELLYSTYLGGEFNEIPHSIIVDSKNELVMLGSTGSSDFPVSDNAFDKEFNGTNYLPTSASIVYPFGSEIVITKFNSQGSLLLGSTYFGGSSEDGLNNTSRFSLEYNYGDFARGDIYIDENDDIFIASCTYSNDIPNTNSNFQPNASGGLDALVARMSPDLSQLKWATYLGGSQDDAAYSIDFADNELVISGGTRSTNFMGLNGLNSSFQGGQADGFIIKLGLDGKTSSAGTYLGTEAYDQSYFVEIDDKGSIYCYGQTLGDYPVTPGKYNVPNATQFIHKLNADLSGTEYSLTFGSPFAPGQTRFINISPTAFLVDKCENVYAIGWGGLVNTNYNFQTGFTDFMETTNDAFSSTTDGSDFYLLVLNQNATGLDYATYLGEPGDRFAGTGREHLDGGTSRFDENGFVYHAACASCGGTDGFPTFPNDVWSSQNNSGNCNMAVFKFEFDRAPINAQLEGSPASGCPPLEVEFENVSNKPGKQFFWNFDDGSFSNEENPTHTFTEAGEYNVQFVIVDSANCIVADTAYFLISVNNDDDSTFAAYTFSIDECNTLALSFENLSQNGSSYLWDFGNGQTSDEFEVDFVFSEEGSYEISLIVDPGSICSDTFSRTVVLEQKNIVATISTEPVSCNDNTVSFLSVVDSSIVPASYLWDFGDGEISMDANPLHVYNSSGDYEVSLTVEDIDGCATTTTETISTPSIDYDFVTSSTDPCAPLNNPITLTAQGSSSSTIGTYSWNFGDGNMGGNFSTLEHVYSEQGIYIVTLIVENEDGCIDTSMQNVEINDNIIINFEQNFRQTSCDFNNLQVDFESGVSIEGDIIENITWDFGDGNVELSSNLSTSHTYEDIGTYEVQIIVASELGCEDSLSFPITVEQSASVAELDDLNLCNGDSALVQLIIEGSENFQILWTPNAGISNDTIANPILFPTTNTTYVYEVTSSLPSGLTCKVVDSVVVNVDADFEINATAEPSNVSPFELIQLNVDEGFFNYEWSPAEFISDPTIYNPTAEIANTTTFVVAVDNGTSCTAIDTVIVVVNDRICDFETIFIPTAFSPNGDQLNDVFRVQSETRLDRFELKVYSRWGDVVFESNDISKFWDGKYKDQLLSTDAFGYTLEVECNGEIRTFQGNITLVR